MRQLLLAAALVAVVCVAGTAQEVKQKKIVVKPKVPQPQDKTKITLKIGDPAPAIKATKWLQNEPVEKFEKGKVYVVEFWATWCGPCIVMMPHMAEMQAEYKSKGVTFVGFSAKDANNSEEKVAAFVKKRGPKLGYTFAYADDRDTNTAWMTASGQRGIPCSFVVDKASRIAYIGHPMFLDAVLPKVVAGTWNGKADAESILVVSKEYSAAAGKLRTDPAAGLEAMAAFEKKHPGMEHIPYVMPTKLAAMLKAGKPGEAKQFADGVVKRATKYDDATAMLSVSATLSRDASGDKDLTSLAVRAAETGAELEKTAPAYLALGNAYFAAGDKAKAREAGKKALDAAAGLPAARREMIEKQIKRFEG